MCTDAEWILKHGITKTVDAPEHSGLYTDTTHATKFRYKEEPGLYNEYKEHMRNSVRNLTLCFTNGLLIDLETDCEVIGYITIKIYDHIKDNFLLPRDLSQEITMARADLKVAYDSDKIVQVYYKKMQNSKLISAALALGDPVTDMELMHCAFKTFDI